MKDKVANSPITNDYTYIKLSNGQKSYITTDSLEHISQYKWHYNNGYAVTNITVGANKSKKILLHRVVFEYYNGPIPKGYQIDHIDRDKLNNRIENLRLATNSENQLNRETQKNNTSGYKGVYFINNKWAAKISHQNCTYFIGRFDDAITAAKAWNKKALELYGDFAYLNAV